MNATITIPEHGEALYNALALELKSNERARVQAQQDGESITFSIQAKDAIVLRATLNSLTNLISVFYQVQHDNESNPTH